jgi:hypothetical protein
MASPPAESQLHGYVKFPKPLFDAILASPMPAVQKDVVWAALRLTIGHYAGQRPHDAAPLGLTVLARMTGHHKSRLSRARQDLLKEGVLVMTTPYHVAGKAAVLYVNQDPASWGAYSVDLSANRQQSAKRGQSANRQQSAKRGQSAKRNNQSAECVQVRPEQSAKRVQEQSAECGPMNTHEELQKNGRAPADDLEGSSGVGPRFTGHLATSERIGNILDRMPWYQELSEEEKASVTSEAIGSQV